MGRYGVDLTVLERVGLQAVRRGLRERRVILVDEIGKMELASEAFRAAMEEAASGPAPLIATITITPHPWADALKRRPEATLHEITRANRGQVVEAAQAWLRARRVWNR